MTTTTELFMELALEQHALVKDVEAAMYAKHHKTESQPEKEAKVADRRLVVAAIRSKLLHPNRGVVRTTPETPLEIPARLLTAGDRTEKFSVGIVKNEKDGSRTFSVSYPGSIRFKVIHVPAEDLDSVTFPVTTRGDSYGTTARNEALGLPEGTDRPIPGPIAEPLAYYPEGTLLGDVHHFDRSKHIGFKCPVHPEGNYNSKQPSVSSWFPTGHNTGCPHTCKEPLSSFIVTADYFPTRHG